MNKFVAVFISMIGLLVGSVALADEDSVLMFVRDGSRDLPLMLEDEVLVMKNMLEAEGYKVVLVTSDGEDLEAGGNELEVDYKLADVSMDNYGAMHSPAWHRRLGHHSKQALLSLLKKLLPAINQ